jgi:hypothetical protein
MASTLHFSSFQKASGLLAPLGKPQPMPMMAINSFSGLYEHRNVDTPNCLKKLRFLAQGHKI